MRKTIRNTTVILKTFISTVVSIITSFFRFCADICHLVYLMAVCLFKPLEPNEPFDPWP